MSTPLFSPSWYRVTDLRPRLRRHARIHRHVYRGEPWYVLEDVANQRVHRFTPAAHSVIGLMDGRRSVQEIWEEATTRLGDDAPGQGEMIQLLAQLHAADVLQSDVPPDTAELLERFEKRERQQLQSRLFSPFAIRIPLLDPDAFLRRLVPHLRPVMGWVGVAAWLAVVLPAIFLIGVHWSELTGGFLDRALTAQNLVLIWLIFPVIKVLHEFGHGIATRYFGGEVHDMGVMFLVFTPVPYVDASSASAFSEKRQRALVAGAGMIVEVFVAALAFYFWLAVEPGVARSVAYNAILIAGVTTLTFNANPLLRFDGYYILSDLVEIPNLRQRSNTYVGYLFERYALGNAEATPPDASSSERGWLVTYSVSAFVYRFFVIAFIVLFVLDLSIVLGTILSIVAAVGWIAVPLTRTLRNVMDKARARGRGSRAVAVLGGSAAAIAFALFVLPLPLHTGAEGVVWIPDEALVRAGEAGFVDRVVAEPGSRVERGDPLIACKDPDLEAGLAILAARLEGLRVRRQRARLEDVSQAAVLDEQIRHVQSQLERSRERLDALLIRAGTDGVFVVRGAGDLPGRYVHQGQLLAHVVEVETMRIRAVVLQEDIELVRNRLDGVQVRLADRVDEVREARVARLVPGATENLPSVALGTEGGGSVAIDPRDSRGTSAVAPLFLVELELPDPPTPITVGGRVHLRFAHGNEPLASRWYRSARQLFLSRLDV